MSVAIAANALINAVVLLFDPAIEVRGGRALGRAWMSYRLSRRSQIIFVQKSCGFVSGGLASPGLSLNHCDSGDSCAQERSKKRFQHGVLPRTSSLTAGHNVLMAMKVLSGCFLMRVPGSQIYLRNFKGMRARLVTKP
jgi:hypothetical protein